MTALFQARRKQTTMTALFELLTVMLKHSRVNVVVTPFARFDRTVRVKSLLFVTLLSLSTSTRAGTFLSLYLSTLERAGTRCFSEALATAAGARSAVRTAVRDNDFL